MAFRTIEQIEAILGDKIRSYRLHMNLSQAEVASKAGVSLPVIIRMEQGDRTTLHAFIAVVKALQLENWFDTFAPIATVDPLNLVNENPRQRASKKRSRSGS